MKQTVHIVIEGSTIRGVFANRRDAQAYASNIRQREGIFVVVRAFLLIQSFKVAV